MAIYILVDVSLYVFGRWCAANLPPPPRRRRRRRRRAPANALPPRCHRRQCAANATLVMPAAAAVLPPRCPLRCRQSAAAAAKLPLLPPPRPP